MVSHRFISQGKMLARARKPHFARFAHPTRPGKAVTILAAGSQEQKLWAWQKGGWEGDMVTFYKEGKRLAKASCSQPISCTSKSCFQLEAKRHHRTDPSQISPTAKQIPHTKNSPCPEWAGWRHPPRGRQARGQAQPSSCWTHTC